jgi:lactate dehydrogenase-like 2-hydroxyacid dehydrogenase
VNVGRHELIDVAAATQALELSHLRGLFIDPVNAEDVSELAQLLDRTEGLNMIVTQHLGARRADVLATMGMWVIRTAKVLVNKLEVH